jgi:hypothetical protein
MNQQKSQNMKFARSKTSNIPHAKQALQKKTHHWGGLKKQKMQ